MGHPAWMPYQGKRFVLNIERGWLQEKFNVCGGPRLVTSSMASRPSLIQPLLTYLSLSNRAKSPTISLSVPRAAVNNSKDFRRTTISGWDNCKRPIDSPKAWLSLKDLKCFVLLGDVTAHLILDVVDPIRLRANDFRRVRLALFDLWGIGGIIRFGPVHDEARGARLRRWCFTREPNAGSEQERAGVCRRFGTEWPVSWVQWRSGPWPKACPKKTKNDHSESHSKATLNRHPPIIAL